MVSCIAIVAYGTVLYCILHCMHCRVFIVLCSLYPAGASSLPPHRSLFPLSTFMVPFLRSPLTCSPTGALLPVKPQDPFERHWVTLCSVMFLTIHEYLVTFILGFVPHSFVLAGVTKVTFEAAGIPALSVVLRNSWGSWVCLAWRRWGSGMTLSVFTTTWKEVVTRWGLVSSPRKQEKRT